MRLRNPPSRPPRRGAVAVLVAILLIPLLGMVAFSVDIGYIKVVQSELHSAADAAALAGVSQLLDRNLLQGNAGNGLAGETAARNEAIRIAGLNSAGNVSLSLDRNDVNDPAGDVVLGHLDNPGNLSEPLHTSRRPFNSVQVRTRRTNARNGPVNLFFARVLGCEKVGIEATATATYEDGIRGFRIRSTGPQTAKLLPFALDVDTWNSLMAGTGPDNWSYDPKTKIPVPGSDGIRETNLYPLGGGSAGNFGTVDIGNPNNAVGDIERQIREGPNQSDFAQIGGELKLGPDGTLPLQGDTGLSAGFKNALLAVRGEPRIVPLYRPPVVNSGNRAVYTIVGFAGVVITDVKLTGAMADKYITVQPEYVIDETALGGGPQTSRFVYRPLRLSR